MKDQRKFRRRWGSLKIHFSVFDEMDGHKFFIAFDFVNDAVEVHDELAIPLPVWSIT